MPSGGPEISGPGAAPGPVDEASGLGVAVRAPCGAPSLDAAAAIPEQVGPNRPVVLPAALPVTPRRQRPPHLPHAHTQPRISHAHKVFRRSPGTQVQLRGGHPPHRPALAPRRGNAPLSAPPSWGTPRSPYAPGREEATPEIGDKRE